MKLLVIPYFLVCNNDMALLCKNKITLNLFAVFIFSCSTLFSKSRSIPKVDIWVDTVVSGHSIKDNKLKGNFRAILYNTEHDQCLWVESLSTPLLNNPKVLVAEPICSIHVAKEKINLTESTEISYKNLEWKDGQLNFIVSYTPLRGSDERVFVCVSEFVAKKLQTNCKEQKSSSAIPAEK